MADDQQPDVTQEDRFLSSSDIACAHMIGRNMTSLLNESLNAIAPIVKDNIKIAGIAALVTRTLHQNAMQYFGLVGVEFKSLDFNAGLDEMLKTPPPSSGKGD